MKAEVNVVSWVEKKLYFLTFELNILVSKTSKANYMV